MTDDPTTPNTAQITVWRNLLDAFSQLSAAWETARDAQQNESDEAGPGTTDIPADLVTSFARAGTRTSEALTGLAEVLSRQPNGEQFAQVRESQQKAHKDWSAAHGATSST
ncbi:hypothetical protein [Haloechinothrix halophila]|uniref:hypothetical protein n=1 Tax=Haloechinothrix halophila TaxID=1069073 RepID=UPI000411A00F|nr:hypothetical protein [Haloechinothrix halophila]